VARTLGFFFDGKSAAWCSRPSPPKASRRLIVEQMAKHPLELQRKASRSDVEQNMLFAECSDRAYISQKGNSLERKDGGARRRFSRSPAAISHGRNGQAFGRLSSRLKLRTSRMPPTPEAPVWCLKPQPRPDYLRGRPDRLSVRVAMTAAHLDLHVEEIGEQTQTQFAASPNCSRRALARKIKWAGDLSRASTINGVVDRMQLRGMVAKCETPMTGAASTGEPGGGKTRTPHPEAATRPCGEITPDAHPPDREEQAHRGSSSCASSARARTH